MTQRKKGWLNAAAELPRGGVWLRCHASYFLNSVTRYLARSKLRRKQDGSESRDMSIGTWPPLVYFVFSSDSSP